MIPALSATLIFIAGYAASLLMGRLMRNTLEKTAFFSGLIGFSVATISPLVLLNELSFGGAQQAFRITPGMVAVAVIVLAWITSLACVVALALKRRAPGGSFKPDRLHYTK